MKTTLLQLLICICCIHSLQSQTIVAGEYFLDQDPGVGQATSIAVSNSTEPVSLNFNVPLQTLGAGFHHLFVRMKTFHGNGVYQWGITESRLLYILPALSPQTALQMIGAEYFIDSDPGIGQGIPLSIVNPTDQLIAQKYALTMPSLAQGLHYLYIRMKDQNNNWGITERREFYICTTYGATANFIHHTSNTDYTVYFTDSSSYVRSRKWDFGDGSFDTLQVNPAHRYTAPGIYQVCLKTVNECGRDSVCKTIQIKGINSFFPSEAGNNSYFTATIRGFGFDRNTKIQLFNRNQTLIPTQLFVLSDQLIKANFVFSNIEMDRWSLKAIIDQDTFIRPNVLTINETRPFQAQVKIISPPSLLMGRFFDFEVQVTNTSNRPGFGIPVYISLNGRKDVMLKSPIIDTFPALTQTAVDSIKRFYSDSTHFYAYRDSSTGDTIKFALLVIPYIEGQKTATIKLKIRSREVSPIRMEAFCGTSVMDSATLRRFGFETRMSFCEPFANECDNEKLEFALDIIGNILGVIPLGITQVASCALSLRGAGCAVKGIADDGFKTDAGSLIDYAFDVQGALGCIPGLSLIQKGVRNLSVSSMSKALMGKTQAASLGDILANEASNFNDIKNIQQKCKSRLI